MQIEVRNLSKRFGVNKGLSPIDFNVSKGELIAVVGHNGAGKSTLMKILANWIRPDSGQVSIDGTDLKERVQIAKRLGFVPEVANLYENFSVVYNLKLFAKLFDVQPIRIQQVLSQFGLVHFEKSKVASLSKGLKQRVNIARALLPNPSILLFDEPTSGLDFEMTSEIYRIIKQMHAEGKTIIFTSHRPEDVKTLASRIIVLHNGQVAFDGSPASYFDSRTHRDLYSTI